MTEAKTRKVMLLLNVKDDGSVRPWEQLVSNAHIWSFSVYEGEPPGLIEFDKMVAEFLSTQDDAVELESRLSDWQNAYRVPESLRRHLFKPAMDRADRYDQYLNLKKEFDPE